MNQNAPPAVTGNPLSPDCSTADGSGAESYCGGWNYDAGFFRSATALGRASAIAVGLAVPAIFVGYLLFEPDYAMRFFQSENGLIMIGGAAGLEVIGAVWLYYLLKVDY